MRRIAIITAALFVLGAAMAYANGHADTASISFSSKKSGTSRKPVPMRFTLAVKATPTGTSRPPVQLEIVTKIYGITMDGKDFPTCSLAKIAAAHNDTVCPKGAKIGSGIVRSLLGSSTNFQQAGGNCDPTLDAWNSGQGKETFFFVTNPTHQCLGGAVNTGETPPYPGTYKQEGKYLVSTVKTPNYINYPLPGLAGSLQYERLVFSTQTRRVHGKTRISQASFACTHHKRPYSITTITTGGPSGSGHVKTVISSKAAC